MGRDGQAAVELLPDVELPRPLRRRRSRDARRQLIAFAATTSHYKAPKSIDFVQPLPRLPSGKLLVRDLKAPYWADRDRNI
jgi:acyl-CoA synthetase (AMP-forming)/AMP-acid ligase II